jgi:hypothetical protein
VWRAHQGPQEWLVLELWGKLSDQGWLEASQEWLGQLEVSRV